jgi:ATP-dependent DNA helicase RecG
MSTLDTPLVNVLGAKTAKALAEHLHVDTVGDLLFHLPRRYEERGQHTDMAGLLVGEVVTVLAQVRSASQRQVTNARRGGRTNILTASIGDGHGNQLQCVFFNQPWRVRDLVPGKWGLFAGTVTAFRGQRQLNGPAYVMLDAADPSDTQAEIEEFAGAFIPVYPATEKLPSWTIARSVRVALDTLTPPPDPLPSRVRAEQQLMSLDEALRELHRPRTKDSMYAARHRLAFDEAFAIQVTLIQRKMQAAQWPAVPRPPKDGGLLGRFDQRLPYTLTEGQRRVGEEIAVDLAQGHPMHRLLQGEVGSGKTVCALRAMLQVVDNGAQAVLLAPTEVLAGQHERGVRSLLGDLGRAGELDGDPDGTRVTLITGSLGAAARRKALAEVADGRAGLVIGTHALLYEGVDFADLGLVVVDEQHRFGVEQRDALRAKAAQPPHVLVMTATPIPRTVAMTVFGDLEVSTLAELPRGRSPISTFVVAAADKPSHLERAWQRVHEEVAKGHQVYVVCPRIGGTGAEDEVDVDDSGKRPPLAVTEIAPLLADGPLHGLRIVVLHGRLTSDEKDAVMRQFAGGELDVLVATTVIEVGVDVPNATMMLVLDAERFGVSQLHQLRGRVGRGRAPGLCLLVTEAPEDSPSRRRLDAVAETLDGFRLAELDLEQRREGDVLGSAQSGKRSSLKVLSLLRDADVIAKARAAAIDVLVEDPTLDSQPALRRAVSVLVAEDRADYLEKG